MGLFRDDSMPSKKAMAGKPEGWYPYGRPRSERYWTGTRWDARRDLDRNGNVLSTNAWYTDSAGRNHRVYVRPEDTPSPNIECPHCHALGTVLVSHVGPGKKIAATAAFGLLGAAAVDKRTGTKLRCTACGVDWFA